VGWEASSLVSLYPLVLIRDDSLAKCPKLMSIKNYDIDIERRPFSASVMSRSCFASFPVCVYKFSSHYLNNIIFIDSSLGPLARESLCIFCMTKWNFEGCFSPKVLMTFTKNSSYYTLVICILSRLFLILEVLLFVKLSLWHATAFF
jgi:hypothetical protein